MIMNSELHSVDDHTKQEHYIFKNDEHSTEDKEHNADEIQDYVDMTEGSARRYINVELLR